MELVRRVRRGDDAAFGRIVDAYGPQLYLIASAMLGNRQDAEDTVQDTFIAAFRGLRRFQGRSTVKTWLTRILINNALNLRRRLRVRRTLPLDDVCDRPGAGPTNAWAQADRLDVRLDFLAVLSRLSEDQRTVVLLREVQGLSYDEIAATLDVPRGTVESRLFRARRKLRDLLGDYLA